MAFKTEADVQEFLDNLGTEYRFGCYYEKRPGTCHLLGDYMSAIKQDKRKAYQLYKKNCDDENYALSCQNTGIYLYSGKACDRNVAAAYKYFEKGCELDLFSSCDTAGSINHHWAFKDKLAGKSEHLDCGYLTQAASFFRKACTLGTSPEACYTYSSFMLKGVPECITENKKEALKYGVKGCDQGSMECCNNVSVMYRDGDGVAQDSILANFYKKIAIDIREQVFEPQEQLTFGHQTES